MFEIDSARTSLPLSPDRVLALVASLNAPMVVVADMPVEPTRAYICAYRDTGDRVAFSIYLHRVESGKGVFYRYDDGPVPRARFDEVMGEAMAFAESLGFMMDDLGWEGLDRARREELVRETPIFLEPEARPGGRAPAAVDPEPPAELVVDASADAGLVGATPISPLPQEAAVPEAPVALPPPPPPPQQAAPPAAAGATPSAPPRQAPLQTTFVPPPVAAPATPQPAAPTARAAAAQAPTSSGAREVDLSIDAAALEPAPPAAAGAHVPAAAVRSAARPAAGAPGGHAAAQALARLLASL